MLERIVDILVLYSKIRLIAIVILSEIPCYYSCSQALLKLICCFSNELPCILYIISKHEIKQSISLSILIAIFCVSV